MTDAALHGYDPNAIAEESPFEDLPTFDQYLGTKTGTREYTFQSGDTQIKVDFTITEGPAGTKNRKVTLSFPAQPEFFTINAEKERVPMTATETAKERQQWCAIVATVQRALGLPTPTSDQLSQADAMVEWAKGGDGAAVSFGAKTNPKSGFADVTCGRKRDGTRFIALRPAKAQVIDKKTHQPVPGLTYEAQARAAIEKYVAKG